MYRVEWLEYPARQGPNGAGGWGKYAKHRPKPVVKVVHVPTLETKGASVYVDGIRKIKCNILDINGNYLRRDYPEIVMEPEISRARIYEEARKITL